MYIQAETVTDDLASATVSVKIISQSSTAVGGRFFLITLDKITGEVTAHKDGATRNSKVPADNLTDSTVVEEYAILAAICFPT